VLGVDPGLVATGFGVIVSVPAGVAVLETGVVATRPHQPLEARLLSIYEGVLEVLDRHRPALLVVEDLYTEYRFPRTALQMAHARGVVCLAARQRAVAVLALAPAEVKRAVACNGGAGKAQMQHAVQRLLRLPELPASSHVADALAVMKAAGIDHDEAAREIQLAQQSPYLKGSELLRNRFRKRNWLIATYRKINRLHPRSSEIERRHKLSRQDFLRDY